MRSFNLPLGLPYFKFLKKEGREKGEDLGRADFAVLQREALENYLIGLIRAVVSVKVHQRPPGCGANVYIRCFILPPIDFLASWKSVLYQYSLLIQEAGRRRPDFWPLRQQQAN